jgi:hypothetical protein
MSEALSPVKAFPDAHALTEGLRAVFGAQSDDSVTLLERRPNPWGGTFPAEIVTCRVDNRGDIRLFCKYETGGRAESHGHRGGVTYERQVYRDLLQPLSLTVPHFYGSCEDRCAGWSWLVLEYLDDSLPVNKVREPDAVIRAADWVGTFHAVMEQRMQCAVLPFLFRYDAAYYGGWAERTVQRCRRHAVEADWLALACRNFTEAVDLLVREPLTILHGEYYPKNIRWQSGVIRPVDWESVAVGAGEIDLASLTEYWPEELAKQCERAYSQARWPQCAPARFQRRLDLARLYLQFRWLGASESWPVREGAMWRIERRIEQVRHIAERQGLL